MNQHQEYQDANSHLDIVVILLNYNGWRDTLDCLQSLEAVAHPNIKKVVVDNASPDRPRELIERVKAKSDLFIQAPRNGGFAYGNNLGIRWALEQGFKYILLLNNDTIVEPDFLSKMLTKMEIKPKVGIMGCRILYYSEPSRIWFNGARINWWKGTGTHYDIDEQASKVVYHPVNEYITGCVMLIRSEVFKRIGLLDESYFMYFEDVAFSQAAIRAGFEIDYEPEAIVYHKVGASGGGGNENWASVYYGNRCRRRFLSSEHYRDKRFRQFVSKSFFYTTRLVKLVIYVSKGDWKLAMVLIAGVFGKDDQLAEWRC